MRMLFCTAFWGKRPLLVNVVNGRADWEDLLPESQKIQLLFCWSLTAPLKNNISPSLNVLEKGGFGSEAYSKHLFSDVY